MQHSILRQQRGTYIQQFIEDLDVLNPRMLGCQKYKLDRLLTQALAELPHEWGFLTNAFVNDEQFDAVHERTRGSLRFGAWSTAPRCPSYSIHVSDAAAGTN